MVNVLPFHKAILFTNFDNYQQSQKQNKFKIIRMKWARKLEWWNVMKLVTFQSKPQLYKAAFHYICL